MAGKKRLGNVYSPRRRSQNRAAAIADVEQPVAEEARQAGAKKTQSSTIGIGAPYRPWTRSGPQIDRKAPRGMLDRSLQAQLGRQLRSIFSDIASEPVPERFIKLLEELEAKEKRR